MTEIQTFRTRLRGLLVHKMAYPELIGDVEEALHYLEQAETGEAILWETDIERTKLHSEEYARFQRRIEKADSRTRDATISMIAVTIIAIIGWLSFFVATVKEGGY